MGLIAILPEVMRKTLCENGKLTKSQISDK